MKLISLETGAEELRNVLKEISVSLTNFMFLTNRYYLIKY